MDIKIIRIEYFYKEGNRSELMNQFLFKDTLENRSIIVEEENDEIDLLGNNYYNFINSKTNSIEVFAVYYDYTKVITVYTLNELLETINRKAKADIEELSKMITENNVVDYTKNREEYGYE